MSSNYQQIATYIKTWSQDLGFSHIGITDTNLSFYQQYFLDWLQQNFAGTMQFMARQQQKRLQPEQLVPQTCRVISVALPYFNNIRTTKAEQAYIANYALGKDYHKIIRKRLQQLAEKIAAQFGPIIYRAFSDSAPVLEKPLAEKAGLGWIGKHTNLINKQNGSWFFLGELFINLPLPVDQPQKNNCGNCTKCINACPTQALAAPYSLDARRCIAYLTIEYKGIIPIALRSLIGNRIFGCDQCQIVCPWNKVVKNNVDDCFKPQHNFDSSTLIELFNWSETEFLAKTQGSALRRIGYECWQRNLAIALGNASKQTQIIQTLQSHLATATPLVKEHIHWALARLPAERYSIPTNIAP